MKILHLISQHPDQTGSGFYIQNMIRQCQAHRYPVHLLAGVSGSQLPEIPFIEYNHCSFVHFEQEDLDFAIPGMSDVMPYPSSCFSSLTEEQLDKYCNTFGAAIRQAAEDFIPDIIHSHHLWFASSMARKVCPQIPIVTSCHSTDLRQYQQNEHLQHRVSNIGRIDRILALSKSQQEQIHQVHGIEKNKINIVGGGYDEHRFVMGNKETSPPVHFLYAGKLSFAKGVPFLLKAMAAIKNDDIHLHLVGSGSGPEKDECLKLAANIAEYVTVHGPMPQKELAKLMAKSHTFVLPSFFEGLPLVLLEALSSGCRILCSDLPGCRELLDKAGPDIVQYIQLPEMANVDKPAPEQLEPFVERIVDGLRKMNEIVTRNSSLQKERIQILTQPYRWESVFSRVEKAYKEVT